MAIRRIYEIAMSNKVVFLFDVDNTLLDNDDANLSQLTEGALPFEYRI